MGYPAQQGLDLAGTLIRIKQIKWAFASQCVGWAAEPFAGLLAAAEGIFGSRDHPGNPHQPIRLLRRERTQFPAVRQCLTRQHDPIQLGRGQGPAVEHKLHGANRQSAAH